MNKILFNEELPFTEDRRFNNPWDLFSRYGDIRDKVEDEKFEGWENFVKAYERWNYRRKNGTEEPNHGQFFFKIEKAKAMFEDLTIEREQWAKVETMEGETESISADWSRKISKYFNKFCIKPWEKRVTNTQHSIFDMLMFCHGVEMWRDPYSVYPESTPVDRVFPDSNASMDPDEWDICFVEQRYTLIELYDEIKDDERAELNGWNVEAIETMLKDASQSTTNTMDGSIIDKFRKGNISNEYSDIEFVIIEAYVKEYKPEDNGNRISVYCFPDGDYISTSSNSNANKEAAFSKMDFLRYKAGCAKDHSSIFAVRNHQTHRSYWQCPSFGEMIYVACRFHDKATNKIIRGAERGLITYIMSDDVNQQSRLANLDDAEVQVLNPSDDIKSTRLGVDVSQLSQVLRQLMIDVEAGVGEDSIPGSQNVKGKSITASEANIRASSANSAQANYIRSFIRRDTAIVKEIYRRFHELEYESNDLSYDEKNCARFIKKMKQLDIPEEAYDPENVLISAVFSLNAGSTQQKITAANMKLQLIRQYHNSTSEGEKRAIREGLAALDSWDNVDYYLDESGELELNSIAKAGRENELMNSNAYLNRLNVQVMSHDKHFMEIPAHLNDIEFSLNAVQGLMQQLQQTPAQDLFIRLDEISDMLVGMENKGAHTLAHIQLASKVEDGAEKAKVFMTKLSQYQGQQQALESQIKGIKEQAINSGGDSNMNNLELQHKAKMYKMDEDHAAAKNQIDLGKNVQKASLGSESANQRHEQQMQHKEQNQSLDIASKQLQAQIELEKKSKTTNNE